MQVLMLHCAVRIHALTGCLLRPGARRPPPCPLHAPSPCPHPPACSYTALTFTDFLEALGRVADMKALPTGMDLADAGYENILEWWVRLEWLRGWRGRMAFVSDDRIGINHHPIALKGAKWAKSASRPFR